MILFSLSSLRILTPIFPFPYSSISTVLLFPLFQPSHRPLSNHCGLPPQTALVTLKCLILIKNKMTMKTAMTMNWPSFDVIVLQPAMVCLHETSTFFSTLHNNLFSNPFLTPFPEPTFVRLVVSFSDNTTLTLYQQYQPPTSLPPILGSCSASYSTLTDGELVVGDDDSDVTSLLTFVNANCQEWLYVDGGVTVLGQKIYFQVDDEGVGSVTGPLSYPPKILCLFFFFSFDEFLFKYLLTFLNFQSLVVFGSQQMLLPCGSEVSVFAEIDGLGRSLHLTSDSQQVAQLDVNVWDDDEVCAILVFLCDIFLPLFYSF